MTQYFMPIIYNQFKASGVKKGYWTTDWMQSALRAAMNPDYRNDVRTCDSVLHAVEYVIATGRIQTPRLRAMMALTGADWRKVVESTIKLMLKANNCSMAFVKEALYIQLDTVAHIEWETSIQA